MACWLPSVTDTHEEVALKVNSKYGPAHTLQIVPVVECFNAAQHGLLGILYINLVI